MAGPSLVHTIRTGFPCHNATAPSQIYLSEHHFSPARGGGVAGGGGGHAVGVAGAVDVGVVEVDSAAGCASVHRGCNRTIPSSKPSIF